MTEQYITIGEIVNTQGIKGEVRVLPLTDFPERFNQMDEVIIDTNGNHTVYQIDSVRYHKKFVIIKFKQLSNMNEAEKLKGSLLKITRDQLMPLVEGHYYIFEIIGLDVFDEAGTKLGKVKQVLQTGANDVYVIKASQGKDILIPALKTVVKEINTEANRMVVELPEGLLD